VLWANLDLLFWLSCYSLLVRAIIACDGRTSGLAVAIGYDFKGWLSIGLYFVSIPLAFVSPWISVAILYRGGADLVRARSARIESTARA
jgi:hypothetical protein